MDTDIEQNSTHDRKLLAQLYQGDQEVRIAQEMIFGIGAVRALRAAGITPSVWHLNEGHGAFLALELLRETLAGGQPAASAGLAEGIAGRDLPTGPASSRGGRESFRGATAGAPRWPDAGGIRPRTPKGESRPSLADAIAKVRGQTLFTTHTPVPAGNDAFPPELMDKYFGSYYAQLGLSRDEFMNLAMHDGLFSMTVLALRLAGTANGVSKLHGEVSRQMWSWVWSAGSWPPAMSAAMREAGSLSPGGQAPIGSITNGVHTASWLAPDLARLYDQYLGADWYAHLDEPARWDALGALPDEELWATHNTQRRKLVLLARSHARERDQRLGMDAAESDALLNPDILTLGFARRFATYKRATLIFRDLERLKRLLNDPQRPVQIIFSGKAHPADMPGREFIRQVYQFSQQDGLRGRILFMEEYNIHTARHLVAGVDVWLNNPRRPLEASGTSGMKASLNGIPTASILDGWWAEGYNGANGWAIGSSDARAMPEEQQDAADAESLYGTLEQQIVPLFYQRDERGIPRGWLKVMKEAIRTVAPQFSTRRMVKEYVELWVQAMAKEGAV